MYYISNICHLCLKQDKGLINLSLELTENQTVKSKFEACITKVSWEKYKNFLICGLCSEILERAYDFSQRCLNSLRMVDKYHKLLQKGGESVAEVPSAVLEVVLSNKSIPDDITDAYLQAQNKNNSPLVYTPVESEQIDDGHVSALYPIVTYSPSVLLNVTNQNSMPDSTVAQDSVVREPAEFNRNNIESNVEHFLFPGSSYYECNKCTASYNTRMLLQNHYLRLHYESAPYECVTCSLKFLFEDQYEEHMNNHLEFGDGILTLDNLKRLDNGKTGKMKRVKKYRIPCDICGKHFYKNYMEKHKKNRHEDKESELHGNENEQILERRIPGKARCNICNKLFKREYLKVHKRYHEDKKSRVYRTTEERKIPILSRISPYKIKCKECDVNYKTVNLLQQHFEEEHNGKHQYECMLCGSKYLLQDYYEEDIKYHTENELKLLHRTYESGLFIICDICGKLITKSSLSAHKRKHDTTKVYRKIHGQENGKTRKINNLYNLRNPINLPTFGCEMCGKTYETMKLLIQHFDEEHEGDRPHKCVFCFSEFLLTKYYEDHMKSHQESLNNIDMNRCDDTKLPIICAAPCKKKPKRGKVFLTENAFEDEVKKTPIIPSL